MKTLVNATRGNIEKGRPEFGCWVFLLLYAITV
jgi:hypothetical protein